MLNFSRYT